MGSWALKIGFSRMLVVFLKLIFITGSLSGLGKGTIAASIASILKMRGVDVTIGKIDPYMNVDAGLMNPHEHGEVYVLEKIWEFRPISDGPSYNICEVDQDFGTYERFLHENIPPHHSITSGQIYLSVILRERAGTYLGKTVQLIPHVTDEIKRRILAIAQGHDVAVIEIGGTVGDYEASIYLEAIRQLRNEMSIENTMLIHVVWVPYLCTVGEFKTKPAQQSFRLLLESGLISDAIIARIDKEKLTEDAKNKLALYSNVPKRAIFELPTIQIIYEVPILLQKQGLDELILKRLKINAKKSNNTLYIRWMEFLRNLKSAKQQVRVALIGKYTRIKDTYISIIEALKHAGAALKIKPIIQLIDAEGLSERVLSDYDAIILTPGFGKRGTDGMIKAAEYALKKNKPFLGICFGAQLATVAFARSVMGWVDADSTEINSNTKYPVVDLLPDQKERKILGGTMRLGGLRISILPDTKLYEIYKKEEVIERFRHRFHIIKEYAERMASEGYVVSAVDDWGKIAAFEVKWHDFFVGVQYHPEYKSRPLQPHPLFVGLLKKSLANRSRSKKDYLQKSH